MFAIGMLFPVMFADRLLHPQRGVLFQDEIFYCILLYGSLFGYGTGVICYWLAPDWMWMYSMDARAVSVPILVYISLTYHLSWFAGIMTGRELLPCRHGLRWTLAIAWCLPIVICGVFFNRIWHIGSLDQFQQGRASPMLSWHPAAVHPVVIVMGLVAVSAVVVLLLMIRYFKPRKVV